jgi:cell division septum initiation protein DivIVA
MDDLHELLLEIRDTQQHLEYLREKLARLTLTRAPPTSPAVDTSTSVSRKPRKREEGSHG